MLSGHSNKCSPLQLLIFPLLPARLPTPVDPVPGIDRVSLSVSLPPLLPFLSLADANGDLDQEVPPASYERRRSRAVLYQLSGHYKQDKIKTKLKLNNVSIAKCPRSCGLHFRASLSNPGRFKLPARASAQRKSEIPAVFASFSRGNVKLFCRRFYNHRTRLCPSTRRRHSRSPGSSCPITASSKRAGIG